MTEKIKFFTHFDPPPSPSLKCEDASLTRQEFVQEADINNIMKRYADGMPLPSGNRQPIYGDFSEVPDYQKSFDIVSHAQEAFAALPSDLRARFDNDPGKLLQFLSDDSNRDEAVELGLVSKPAEVKPSEKSVSVPAEKAGEGE